MMCLEMPKRLGAWDTTNATRAECYAGVWAALERSHARLPRQNVCLVQAQLVQRLDLGSVIIAHRMRHTTRIMDALNAFLIMSVYVGTNLHRQEEISANFVS